MSKHLITTQYLTTKYNLKHSIGFQDRYKTLASVSSSPRFYDFVAALSETLSVQDIWHKHKPRSNRKERRFSYLMEEYGRLRVREYNTLHRAIRKSSWGPVRCSIALHLRVETVMGYPSTNMNTMDILALPT